MNYHYLFLPVAPLSAEAVLTVMETLDSQCYLALLSQQS